MPSTLYHISENPHIDSFEPLPAPVGSGMKGEMVWAIDYAHLQNYLFPRDCPRITYYPSAKTTHDEKNRFFFGSEAKHVLAIEQIWLQRLISHTIYCYELSGDHFTLIDDIAGYYTSDQRIVPTGMTVIDNIPQALLKHDIELRVLPSLWKLYDEVINSSLNFSIIRMRNALPRIETLQ